MDNFHVVYINVCRGRAQVKSFKRSTLERGAIGGNSPVFKKTFMLLAIFLKYCRA